MNLTTKTWGSFLLALLFAPFLQAAEPDTILIDFGNNLSPAPWNNIAGPWGDTIPDLLLSSGLNSAVTVAVTDSFNNINTAGTQAPIPPVAFPGTATGDSFFGNTSNFGGQIQPTGAVTFSGLSVTTAYNFTIFASRMSTSDNRETQYEVIGQTADTTYLDPANNESNLATITGMYPAADGTITLMASPGPNNTNGTGFYYLGAVMIDYTLSEIDTINIDFGNNLSTGGWNNISDPVAGQEPDLINSMGLNTGVSAEINDPFNNINLNGTTTPDPGVNMPSTATGDSFFGNTATFGGQIQETGGLMLSGLDTATAYSFTIFASRMGVGDNRETQYTLSGKTVEVVALDAANNDSVFVAVTDLYPDAAGQISLLAEPGPNNTNGSGFYYLGAIRMTYSAPLSPPQPESLALLAPTGGERWEVGKDAIIRWESSNVISLALAYSNDNGQTWTAIDTVPGFDSEYAWTVPDDTTSQALVRATSATLDVMSDSVFTIAEDNGRDCHIVILGSSTAAGTGPSNPDSAWVVRYSDYLYQRNTDFVVTNLAQGGFTTYNVLPTGTTIPTGVNQTINTGRNITQALSLDPDAIIINLPSNDAANGYPVADQLANYDLIVGAADADTVPVWVATPQPRDFGTDLTKVQIQLDMVDSTFARYGEFAIDFWTGFGDSANAPLAAYDSGDGIHLNNAGHKILFERVIGAGVHTYLLDSKQNTLAIEAMNSLISALRIFPNPVLESSVVSFDLESLAPVRIDLTDLQGREISTLINETLPAGSHAIALKRSNLPAGLYLCRIQIVGSQGVQQLTQRVLLID